MVVKNKLILDKGFKFYKINYILKLFEAIR